MLGVCNTCVRLQSRVTSSGATVNSWMILFYFSWLLLMLLLLFVCFFFLFFLFLFVWFVFLASVGLFVDVCFQVCVVVVIALACWSVNYCFYFGIVYKFVVSHGSLAVIRELFIILYIVNIFYQFIVIFHIDCLCLCRCVS